MFSLLVLLNRRECLEKEREACENCVYNQKWFCIIMGDYVKRSGHCSEYEEQKKKIDTP